MSMSYEVYGSQILGIGGRLEWDEGAGAGNYGSPAFVYDANQQEVVSSFRVCLCSSFISSIVFCAIPD